MNPLSSPLLTDLYQLTMLQAYFEAGMTETRIAASGDLEEERIAELVAADAPIDLWGVGTELGTSRDSPVVNGVYKLVADRGERGWRGVFKTSPDKQTLPGAKQVFRSFEGGRMAGDVIATAEESVEEAGAAGAQPLLVPAMRGGERVLDESLEEIRDRTRAELEALPGELRLASGGVDPYPVQLSPRLRG